MALITEGSIDKFSVLPVAPTLAPARFVDLGRGIPNVRVLTQTSPRFIGDAEFVFGTSSEPRGVGLRSIQLKKEAQQYLVRLFGASKKVYFLSWAWDLSGTPVHTYPPPGMAASAGAIPLKSEELREYMGDGVLLFPTKVVTGGIQLRIQVWESKHGTRSFGEAMQEVGEAILQSDLNKLLTGVGLAVHPALVATAATDATALLSVAIGKILKKHGDDVLDLYEGNFSAWDPWPVRPSTHSARGTRIMLSHLRRPAQTAVR